MNVEVQPRYTLADYQIDEDYVVDERPAITVVVALWSPDFGDSEIQAMHDLTLTSVHEVRNAGGSRLSVVIDSSDLTSNRQPARPGMKISMPLSTSVGQMYTQASSLMPM